MKLFFTILSSLFLFSSSLYAQDFKFGPPDGLLHGANCNIKSSPGIAGDNYYVLYNDYGKSWDMNNNIDSYLKIYSIKRGHLIKSVYLNRLVSGSVRNKKILFNEVILWKNHILGLYTTKNPRGSEFEINAQLFDLKGKKIGKPAMLGLFSHEYNGSSVAGQGGMLIDGRNILSVANELHYAFNADSSKMALLTSAGKGNIGFTIINPDLKVLSKATVNIPAIAKRTEVLQFKQDRRGMMYLLMRGRRGANRNNDIYDLFSFDINNNNLVKIPLSLAGKVILDAAFSFGKSDITLTGSYYNEDKKGNHASTNGVFAIKVGAASNKIIHTDVHEFSDDMVKELASKKAASKGKGLDEVIQIKKIVKLTDGGIIAFGQSHDKITQIRGSTGALNSFYDEYGNVDFFQINPTGEIKWNSYVNRYAINLEMTTSAGSVYSYNSNHQVTVVYDAESKKNKHIKNVCFNRYDESGKAVKKAIPLPKEYNKHTMILWATARKINSGEIIAAYYQAKQKEMGTVKITLPN